MESKNAPSSADADVRAMRHDAVRLRLKNLCYQKRTNTGPKRSDAVFAEQRDATFAALKRLDKQQASDHSSLTWACSSVCDGRFMFHIGIDYREDDAAKGNFECVRLYPSPVRVVDMLAPRVASDESSECQPPALDDRGHASYDHEYYVSLTNCALGPVQLLSNFVRAHDTSGLPELPRPLYWDFEEWPVGDWHRARCGFSLSGNSWSHIGPWRCTQKLARSHCAALVLELFQVDPHAFGGAPGRSLMNAGSQAEHTQVWGAIRDVTDRLSKMRQLLIRFPQQLGQGLEQAGRRYEKAALLEWSFEQAPEAYSGNGEEYRASCYVALLVTLGWSCSTFTGDWAKGKQAAKQSACLVLQAYLTSIENFREAVHSQNRRAKRLRRKARWKLKKEQMSKDVVAEDAEDSSSSD